MVQGYEILKKLTTRNILATSVVGTFLWAIHYGVTHIDATSKALESSSLLSALVGVFTTVVTLILVFYFRKAQDKESTG